MLGAELGLAGGGERNERLVLGLGSRSNYETLPSISTPSNPVSAPNSLNPLTLAALVLLSPGDEYNEYCLGYRGGRRSPAERPNMPRSSGAIGLNRGLVSPSWSYKYKV